MRVCDMCKQQTDRLYNLSSSFATVKAKEVCQRCDKFLVAENVRTNEALDKVRVSLLKEVVRTNTRLTLTPEELRKLMVKHLEDT